MLRRYRSAYNRPWTKSSLRYVGEAKDFWGYMVAETTGCARPELLDDIYDYYARREAWTLAPGSRECLKSLREMGVKLAIVSNFDTRLRPLLEDMEVKSSLLVMLLL
jgi:FMN phosphatase YigB (HAD superfamily)